MGGPGSGRRPYGRRGKVPFSSRAMLKYSKKVFAGKARRGTYKGPGQKAAIHRWHVGRVRNMRAQSKGTKMTPGGWKKAYSSHVRTAYE